MMFVLLAIHLGVPPDLTQKWTGVTRDGADVLMAAMGKISKQTR